MESKPERIDSIDCGADQETLAQKLRESREFLGLSQEQVAEKLDIPRPAVSAIENGKRRVNSTELKQFAQLYRRSVDYLLSTNGAEDSQDELLGALFRATSPLSETDREQVLRFAEFLKNAGKPPASSSSEEKMA